MRVQAAVFDFDLTLADSTAGVVECVNHALSRLGFSPIEPSKIRATIGLALPRVFQALTGASDSSRVNKFYQWFVERADQVMADRTILFPEVPEAVARLRAAGIRTGIVSTKFRYRIEGILAREKLDHAFEVIVGGEDVAVHKPDPEGLIRALGHLDVEAGRAVYVGDHPVDAEAASRAGVPFMAVLTGTSRAHDFNGCAVAGLLSSLSELPGVLSGPTDAPA